MNQGLWNLLFGWITGRQCFLPEGCNIPLSGVVVYLLLLAAIISTVVIYLNRDNITADE